MIIKKDLKKNNGIIVSDAIVAILVLLLFAGIMTTLMTNIFLESARIKISSQQMDFATEIFEYVEKINYADVNEENLIKYVEAKNIDSVKAAATIEEIDDSIAYKIAIDVETYIPKDKNLPELDLIKTITLTIENNLADEPYTTTLSKVRKASMEEVKEIVGQ